MSSSNSAPTTPRPSTTDASNNYTTTNSPIVNDISQNIITEPGLQITTEQGTTEDGSHKIQTTFVSTNPELYDPNINQDMTQVVNVYDDTSGANASILNQIKSYATQIQCESFHGKGSIDDYAQLFQAASKIANETKQIQLDIDINGFNEFASAADELSNLFQSFTLKLQNVNIINDTNFLQAILNALQKIVNLSNVFGRFKETILTTTTIQFPKSAHDTKVVLEGVMDEINCAMQYITNFVSPSDTTLENADLSPEEKNIIDKAVETIDRWGVICDQGVSIAMANNPDVQFIKNASDSLKVTTANLKNATNNLKTKLNTYMNF